MNEIVISEEDEDEICLETVGAPVVDTVIDVTITYGTAESEGEFCRDVINHSDD